MTKVLQTVLASVPAVAAGAVVALVTYAVCPKLRAEINGVREYSWKGYSEIKKQQALVNKLEIDQLEREKRLNDIRYQRYYEYGDSDEMGCLERVISRRKIEIKEEKAKLELMKQQNRILV